jgi:hypothetical protein
MNEQLISQLHAEYWRTGDPLTLGAYGDFFLDLGQPASVVQERQENLQRDRAMYLCRRERCQRVGPGKYYFHYAGLLFGINRVSSAPPRWSVQKVDKSGNRSPSVMICDRLSDAKAWVRDNEPELRTNQTGTP